MSRRPTHGARALTAKLFATKPPTPIRDRQRRALRAIQHALTAQPIDHLHALTVGRLARFELILQGYEAWCLAHPEEPAPKHMLAVANSWRRTGEFLALLDERIQRDGRALSTCADCGAVFADPTGYLRHVCPLSADSTAAPVESSPAAATITVAAGTTTDNLPAPPAELKE